MTPPTKTPSEEAREIAKGVAEQFRVPVKGFTFTDTLIADLSDMIASALDSFASAREQQVYERCADIIAHYRLTDKYAFGERGILVNLEGLIRAEARKVKT